MSIFKISLIDPPIDAFGGGMSDFEVQTSNLENMTKNNLDHYVTSLIKFSEVFETVQAFQCKHFKKISSFIGGGVPLTWVI